MTNLGLSKRMTAEEDGRNDTMETEQYFKVQMILVQVLIVFRASTDSPMFSSEFN